MGRTRRELYDLANNYYSNAELQLLEHDHTFSRYKISYQDQDYLFCIALSQNNYTGKDPIFYFRNQSEKFARNLCWKKIIEPTLTASE